MWDHDLRKNFKLSQFKKWVDQDILSKIGEDRMGRPVLLFKTYNFFADMCHDVSEYMNFLFFLIQIEIMSKCKGYIDELIMLADSSNNSMKNMKI